MLFHFAATAEANPKFCRMAKLWAWSLRHLGGALADGPITVCFNDESDAATAGWLEQLKVRVRSRPRLSEKHKEVNKYNVLWTEGIENADWVVLTDCDVVCTNDLAPLADWLAGHEFGAVSDAVVRYDGRPYRHPVIHYPNMLRAFTGLSVGALQAHQHPEFTGRPPFTVYPYFNGGMLAIKGAHVPAFRKAVVDISRRIYAATRPAQWNGLRVLQRAWNNLWDKSAYATRLCVGWHLRPRYADQSAIFPAVLKLALSYQVLPHVCNWRYQDLAAPGAEPLLLHYYEQALGIPPPRILDGTWLDSYRTSADRGRVALAQTVQAFLREYPGQQTGAQA